MSSIRIWEPLGDSPIQTGTTTSRTGVSVHFAKVHKRRAVAANVGHSPTFAASPSQNSVYRLSIEHVVSDLLVDLYENSCTCTERDRLILYSKLYYAIAIIRSASTNNTVDAVLDLARGVEEPGVHSDAIPPPVFCEGRTRTPVQTLVFDQK